MPVAFSVGYDAAVRFMNDGECEKALIEFRKLEGYSDSASKASSCEDLLYRLTYPKEIGLMNYGEYDEARFTFWGVYGTRSLRGSFRGRAATYFFGCDKSRDYDKGSKRDNKVIFEKWILKVYLWHWNTHNTLLS